MSGAEWLRKFEFDMEDYQDQDGNFPPAKYLNYMEILPTDLASKWSESHSEAIRLLIEAQFFLTQQIII